MAKVILLNEWYKQHSVDERTNILIDRWLDAIALPEEALAVEWKFEEWLKDQSQPVPDMVQCAALYGHTRLLLNDWTLPIDVPESEFDQWRAENYRMTLEDFQERLAGVAGGFLDFVERYPQQMVDLFKRQLAEKLAQLEELANLPLAQYTPMVYEEGVEYEGDEEIVEQRAFNRPFLIYEELLCFEWAIEKFRMIAITEDNPKTNKPDVAAHDALLQLDLNTLLYRLGQSEVKLRHILNYLARHSYWRLDDESAPDNFGWRHWRKEVERRSRSRHGKRTQR